MSGNQTRIKKKRNRSLVRPPLYPYGMSKKPSLLETHPEVAREAHGWDPQAVTHGSRKKLAWKCKLGHIWEAQPNDRTGAKSGCPVCANRKLLVGFNDLATTHPALAAQAHGWDPSAVMAGSSVNLEWICEKGHIWQSIPVSRVRQETGCLVCLGKQVEKGFNDLVPTAIWGRKVVDYSVTTDMPTFNADPRHDNW